MARIERKKNATRNIIFGVILKAYQIVVPFLMRTAMIYFMGVQYLGLNSLFTSILQVLNLAELGAGSAMIYSMYQPIASDDKKKICALMRLYKFYYRTIGCVIAFLGLLLLPFIPHLVKSDLPDNLNIYVLSILIQNVIVVIVDMIVCYAICQMVHLGGIMTIIFRGAVCVVFSNISYFAIWKNNEDFKDAIKLLNSIFKGKR